MTFRDVSLYTETISSPEQAPAVIHQAIAAAYSGRGVAHLTIPVTSSPAKANGRVSSIATLKSRDPKLSRAKTTLPRSPAASTKPAVS